MYCINCGVKLADTEKSCPLCGVAVFHPQLRQEDVEPLYPHEHFPEPQVAPRTAQIVLTTMFLLPMLVTLLCDLQISGAVTWSGYVAGALAVAYVMFVLPLWFRRHHRTSDRHLHRTDRRVERPNGSVIMETAPVRQIQRILEIHPRSIPGITFRRSTHKHILVGQTDGIRHGLPPDTDMGIFLRTHHRLLGVYDLRYQRMEST